MWPRGDGPEEDEADSTNTAGLQGQPGAGIGSLEVFAFTDVTVPGEEENPLVLPHGRHALTPPKPHSMLNIVCWPVI